MAIHPYQPSLLVSPLDSIQCRSALLCLCVAVHMVTSLMSSSLPLQPSPTCLVRLASIVCKMGVNDPTALVFASLFKNFFIHRSIKRTIWLIDRSQTGTTTPGQSWFRNNYERVFHIFHIFKSGASSSGTVSCHAQGTPFFGRVLPSILDTVIIFKFETEYFYHHLKSVIVDLK